MTTFVRGTTLLLLVLCTGCASPYDPPTLAGFVQDGELLEAQVGEAWAVDLDRVNASYKARTLTDVKFDKHFTTVLTPDYTYMVQADEGGVHCLRVKPRHGRGPFPPPAFVQRGALVGLYSTGVKTWGLLYATDRDRLWLGVTPSGSLDRLEWVAPAHAIERWASTVTLAVASADVRKRIRARQLKAVRGLIAAIAAADSSLAKSLEAEAERHERRVAAQALALAKTELARWARGRKADDVAGQVQWLAELRRLARGWKQKGVVFPEAEARLSATTMGVVASARREPPEVRRLLGRLLEGDIDRLSDGGRALLLEARAGSQATTLRAQERHCDAVARALKTTKGRGLEGQLRREHLTRARAALASALDQAAARDPRSAWAYRWAAKRVRAKESAQGLEQIPRISRAWEALQARRGLSLQALRDGLATIERTTPWLLRALLKQHARPTLRARAEAEARAAAAGGRVATAAGLSAQAYYWSGQTRWPEPRTVRDVQLRPKIGPIGTARRGLVPYALRFLPAPKPFASGGSRLRPYYADRPLPRFPLVDVLGLRLGEMREFRAAYEAVTPKPRAFHLARRKDGARVWEPSTWADRHAMPSFSWLFGDPKLADEGKWLRAERTWIDGTFKRMDAQKPDMNRRNDVYNADVAAFNKRTKIAGAFSSRAAFESQKRELDRRKASLAAEQKTFNALVQEYERRRAGFNKRVYVYNDAQSKYRARERDKEAALIHGSLTQTLEEQIGAWAKAFRRKSPGPEGAAEVAWMRWWFGLDPRQRGIGVVGSLKGARGVLKARRDRIKATIFDRSGAKAVGIALGEFAALLEGDDSLTQTQRLEELKPLTKRYLSKFGLDAYFGSVMMRGRAPNLCKAALTPKQQQEITAKAREIMRKYREAMRKRR